MDQENSNDIRPAGQIAPHPALTAAEQPDEYFIIKIPKRKVYKFIKITLIIMFILSLWTNLAFIHALKRGRHDMSIHMSIPRRPQIEVNRGGGLYKPDSFKADFNPDERLYSNWDTYYFGNGIDHDGYFSENFRLPSR